MPGPTACTVTGTFTDASGAPLVGATLYATNTVEYVNDGQLVPIGTVSAVTNGSGIVSLVLLETATMYLAVSFALQVGEAIEQLGFAVIPNQSSIDFSALTLQPFQNPI